jgi:hypothetical protein
MNPDPLAIDQAESRGVDSNLLLRLYDQARAIFDKSPSQQERVRADKVVQRLAKELQKRNVLL